MTGPNDSSIAMYMWSCTSVNIVGSKKKPGGGNIRSQPTYHHTSYQNHTDWLKSATRYTTKLQCRYRCLTWSLHLFATTDQSGSLLDASLTILHQFVQVGFVVLRAVVCGAVQWITDLHLLYLLNLRGSDQKYIKCF